MEDLKNDINESFLIIENIYQNISDLPSGHDLEWFNLYSMYEELQEFMNMYRSIRMRINKMVK